MDYQTREIVDVFHAHAFSDVDDWYARKHVHGLSPSYLSKAGYCNVQQLFSAFYDWLYDKSFITLYGNYPAQEIADLKISIRDIKLDSWRVRRNKTSHKIALLYKKLFIPIKSIQCCEEAHSHFKSVPTRPFNLSDAAKEEHGFHCSLYDTYEMYLFYLQNL